MGSEGTLSRHCSRQTIKVEWSRRTWWKNYERVSPRAVLFLDDASRLDTLALHWHVSRICNADARPKFNLREDFSGGEGKNDGVQRFAIRLKRWQIAIMRVSTKIITSAQLSAKLHLAEDVTNIHNVTRNFLVSRDDIVCARDSRESLGCICS